MATPTYTLVSGIELHEQKPDRFFVPSEEVKKNLQPGDRVRLVFDHENIALPRETLWVWVDEVNYPNFKGRLADWSLFNRDMSIKMEVEFKADHVVFVQKSWQT